MIVVDFPVSIRFTGRTQLQLGGIRSFQKKLA